MKKKTIVEEVKGKVMLELEKSRQMAEKEMAKVKKHVDASIKKVDEYVKKNPKEAAAIAAGIGAALGATLALLMSKKKK
jgi:ElaB/YqjD/DUF883 family membrane-anchored ribosome-binding protein